MYSSPLAIARVIVCMALSWAPQSIGPNLVLDGSDFNAGQVLQGETIEHTITIRNSGDRILMIKDVKARCSDRLGEFNPQIRELLLKFLGHSFPCGILKKLRDNDTAARRGLDGIREHHEPPVFLAVTNPLYQAEFCKG
jgi:hypothetical protein